MNNLPHVRSFTIPLNLTWPWPTSPQPVTSAMVEMIMSMMVIVNENRKKILRALNIIHEVEFMKMEKLGF